MSGSGDLTGCHGRNISAAILLVVADRLGKYAATREICSWTYIFTGLCGNGQMSEADTEAQGYGCD